MLSRQSLYRQMVNVAIREYGDLVDGTSLDDESCKVYFSDGSFLEVWLGLNKDPMDRFAFHWERRHMNGLVFRHDNAPHASWSGVSTFPKHFHNGSEDEVVDSGIPDEPLDAFRYFMDFIRMFLSKHNVEVGA